jgi:hypothetical protein
MISRVMQSPDVQASGMTFGIPSLLVRIRSLLLADTSHLDHTTILGWRARATIPFCPVLVTIQPRSHKITFVPRRIRQVLSGISDGRSPRNVHPVPACMKRQKRWPVLCKAKDNQIDILGPNVAHVTNQLKQSQASSQPQQRHDNRNFVHPTLQKLRWFLAAWWGRWPKMGSNFSEDVVDCFTS